MEMKRIIMRNASLMKAFCCTYAKKSIKTKARCARGQTRRECGAVGYYSSPYAAQPHTITSIYASICSAITLLHNQVVCDGLEMNQHQTETHWVLHWHLRVFMKANFT